MRLDYSSSAAGVKVVNKKAQSPQIDPVACVRRRLSLQAFLCLLFCQALQYNTLPNAFVLEQEPFDDAND